MKGSRLGRALISPLAGIDREIGQLDVDHGCAELAEGLEERLHRSGDIGIAIVVEVPARTTDPKAS